MVSKVFVFKINHKRSKTNLNWLVLKDFKSKQSSEMGNAQNQVNSELKNNFKNKRKNS